VTLPPSQDATIYESSADISNGSGEYLFAGNTNRDLSRRALVRFDIAGSIPAGSIIFSVRVEMRMNKTVAAPASLDLHRLSASWDEGSTNASGNEGRGLTAAPGDVSWNATSAGGDAWARRGGDFEDQTSATATAGSTNGSTITWSSTDGLVADVQAWLDDPTNNHGWIVVGDETGPQTAKRINSRHGAFGPELIIEYAELVLG